MDRAGLLTQGQNRDGQRCVSIIPLPLNRPLREPWFTMFDQMELRTLTGT